MKTLFSWAWLSCLALACGSESSRSFEETGGAESSSGGQGAGAGAAMGGVTSGSGGTVATVPACSAGLTQCGTECVALSSNAANCGACGMACVAGQSCVNSQCVCQSGLTSCLGVCVDLQGDGANCGACGVACPAGQLCSAGTCGTTCTVAGQTPCGQSCVDLMTDELNCGTCGAPCAAGQECTTGVCTCPVGLTLCSGACVDTSSSLANCGACGTACQVGQACQSGTCVGGTAGTGGVVGAGGVATGGVGAGGVATGGGVSTGGAATGGVLGSGGAATGGGVSTGGAATGGVLGSGGAVVGSGGDATGGSAGTGGEAPVAETTLVTSGPNSYWQDGQLTEATGNPNITVNESTTYQDWDGFGGTFNEKGWQALMALSATDRDLAIRLLFDKTAGCGFTWGRIPIGSSDYGLSRYSLNETAGDYEMTNFSIARDLENLIPYIKAALAVKADIRFWGSPWSPPTWMKSNGAFDRGEMLNDPQILQAHALYLARFVEEYAAQGINVEAVCPQNEPGYPQDYPSCLWDTGTSASYADYIANYLGPLFAQRLPSTDIWLGTMSNPTSSAIVSSVMSNGTAAGYVSTIGLQWGMETYAAQYVDQYNVPVMQTEHKCGNYPWEEATYEQTAPNDHAYAVESWGLLKSWIGAGVNSYSAWNMVLDTVGRSLDEVRPWAQNALLTVNTSTGTLIPTPAYYVFRHLAQFVDPGSVRVGTTGGDALAFRNPDGSLVAVMYNSGGSASSTTLAIGTATLQFSIPATGWATVDWQP